MWVYDQEEQTPEQTLIMEKMAKFRNIVLHQYEAVDAEIVVLILRRHLDDFHIFSDAIARYVGVKAEPLPM